MRDAPPYAIRQALPSDLQFVFSSWVSSMRGGEPFCSCDRNWFSAAQHALISRLLQRSTIVIACNEEDPDQIFGYAVFEPRNSVIHYIYIKQMFRGVGICRSLIESCKAKRGSIRAKNANALAAKFGLEIHTKWLLENS